LDRERFKQSPLDLNRAGFLALFGPVYEHSPWIAAAVFDSGLGPDCAEVAVLHETMRAVVEAAPRDRQLALLQAHPDLAGRLAVQGGLTRQSASEQAGVGLDRCSPEEFAAFTRLNQAYQAKFGFPFIIAVKGRSRAEILAAFERRLANSPSEEFRTALDEVHEIARFRLAAL
jgi:2-oxo-4-hydroxy-4-carboxy-5-ureidoimidazoline decarboxylase